MGSSLTIIGNGSAPEAAQFQEEFLGYDVRLFAEPSLTSYQALELKRSLWTTLKPRTYFRGLLSWRRGGRFGSVGEGDAFQQGGAFIITPKGEVPFSYYSQAPEDHVDPQDILAAMENLPASDLRTG